MLCPRCGSELAGSFGAQVGCGHCGGNWQADALTAEPRRPVGPSPDPDGSDATAHRRLDGGRR